MRININKSVAHAGVNIKLVRHIDKQRSFLVLREFKSIDRRIVGRRHTGRYAVFQLHAVLIAFRNLTARNGIARTGCAVCLDRSHHRRKQEITITLHAAGARKKCLTEADYRLVAQVSAVVLFQSLGTRMDRAPGERRSCRGRAADAEQEIRIFGGIDRKLSCIYFSSGMNQMFVTSSYLHWSFLPDHFFQL